MVIKRMSLFDPKYEKIQIHVFFILILISIVLDLRDKKTRECFASISKEKRVKLISILLFHHIINIFANFGWLFNHPIILSLYVISPIFMLAYWKLNDNKCDVTLWANKICQWEGDTYFNDLYNILGWKQHEIFFKVYHKILLGIGMCIAIYKLSRWCKQMV